MTEKKFYRTTSLHVQFSDDDMLTVISLQQLDGQWISSEKLLNTLCVTEENLIKLTVSDVSAYKLIVLMTCLLYKLNDQCAFL
jgi:hypothetical protein